MEFVCQSIKLTYGPDTIPHNETKEEKEEQVSEKAQRSCKCKEYEECSECYPHKEFHGIPAFYENYDPLDLSWDNVPRRGALICLTRQQIINNEVPEIIVRVLNIPRQFHSSNIDLLWHTITDRGLDFDDLKSGLRFKKINKNSAPWTGDMFWWHVTRISASTLLREKAVKRGMDAWFTYCSIWRTLLAYAVFVLVFMDGVSDYTQGTFSGMGRMLPILAAMLAGKDMAIAYCQALLQKGKKCKDILE